jgi:hypothetical protein
LEKKEMKTIQTSQTGMLLLGLILLLCTLVAVQTWAQSPSGSREKPLAMAWQHLALTQTIGETPAEELARNINKLGREGWELVSVGNITKAGTTTKTVFYFKKPL